MSRPKAHWKCRAGFLRSGRIRKKRIRKGEETFKMTQLTRMLPWLVAASLVATAAHAAGNKVVIGDIDDMSGLYADVIGPGGVEAAKMAIEDFGGSVLGNKIQFMETDHQNK